MALHFPLIIFCFLFHLSALVNANSNYISTSVMYWEPNVPQVRLPIDKAFLLNITAETFCDTIGDSSCSSLSVTSPSVGLLIFQTNTQHSASSSFSEDPAQYCSVSDYFSQTEFPKSKIVPSSILSSFSSSIFSPSPAYIPLPSPLEYMKLSNFTQNPGPFGYALLIDCGLKMDSSKKNRRSCRKKFLP